jgi:predicted TIM-barrel fold metal-dependent hydrolase
MSAYRVISADDHVQEPKDTWERRVPAKFRNRAPRVVNVDGGDVWMMDGKVVMKMGMNAAAGKKFEEYKLEGETYQTIRPGAFDPHERLKDMDADGIEGAVIFPNAFWAFMVEDFELQLACMRAYNDFLAEFCQTNPRRLIGIGLVPTDNVEEGVREAQRVAKLGMHGVLVSSFPKAGPLSSEVFDPLWAAAQDLGLPVHLHLAVGDTRGQVFHQERNVRGLLPGQILINSIGNMEALARILFGGVGELFPKLKIVSVEGNIGWIPYFLERADRIYQRHRFWSRLELPMPPSEYFHRQVYATFIEDKAGIRLRDLIGVDNLMWSSDYPHTDTTWPHSLKYIEDTMAGVPEDEKRKIIGGNAARLYGLD